MVNLPAVCNACGTIFPSGFAVGVGSSNYFSSNTSGPCPGCGGVGRVPDGTIDLSRPDVVAALRAMAQLGSIHNLRRMLALLSVVRSDDLLAIRQTLTSGAADRSEDQVIKDVQQAAPGLRNAASLIRNRDNRMELAIWLTLIAAIIPIVIALKSNQQEVTPPRQEQIIQLIVPTPSARPALPIQAQRRTPGRNERCPCGSGKKFKHCHDSPTARP